MTDEAFMQKLFDKYELTKDEERQKVLKIFDEIKQEEPLEKVISSFSDKIDLAEKLIGMNQPLTSEPLKPILPLHFDSGKIWWRWNHREFRWAMIDETDLLNNVWWSSPANTINPKERTEILNALRQVARANRPQMPKESMIQFADEVIDIETGERFKADHNLFLTNPIPYKIGKNGETPVIDRIFKEWVGEDNVLLLKEIIAYCMLRDYPINRIFCFIGAGLNGKSKFLELLRKFIGEDNCCSTELDTLLNSRFEVTRLHKKLVCQMGETNLCEISRTSMLKKLSGGDLIGFEYKNKNPFEDRNYAKIIIATNNLPSTTDKTIGFYRRWLIVDFPNQFNEKKNILDEIPEKEYENLAYACIGILINLLKNREFTNEGSIEHRMKNYEDKSNPLEKFMREYVVEDYESFIWKFEFEKRLNQWCRDNRFREMYDVVIGKKMKELGVTQQLKNAGLYGEGKKWRAWVGIKWKSEETEQVNQVEQVTAY